VQYQLQQLQVYLEDLRDRFDQLDLEDLVVHPIRVNHQLLLALVLPLLLLLRHFLPVLAVQLHHRYLLVLVRQLHLLNQ